MCQSENTCRVYSLSVYHVGSAHTYVIRLGYNGLHSLSHLVGPPYDFFPISLCGKTVKKSLLN